MESWFHEPLVVAFYLLSLLASRDLGFLVLCTDLEIQFAQDVLQVIRFNRVGHSGNDKNWAVVEILGEDFRVDSSAHKDDSQLRAFRKQSAEDSQQKVCHDVPLVDFI